MSIALNAAVRELYCGAGDAFKSFNPNDTFVHNDKYFFASINNNFKLVTTVMSGVERDS